jgi:hypothetical protein
MDVAAVLRHFKTAEASAVQEAEAQLHRELFAQLAATLRRTALMLTRSAASTANGTDLKRIAEVMKIPSTAADECDIAERTCDAIAELTHTVLGLALQLQEARTRVDLLVESLGSALQFPALQTQSGQSRRSSAPPNLIDDSMTVTSHRSSVVADARKVSHGGRLLSGARSTPADALEAPLTARHAGNSRRHDSPHRHPRRDASSTNTSRDIVGSPQRTRLRPRLPGEPRSDAVQAVVTRDFDARGIVTPTASSIVSSASDDDSDDSVRDEAEQAALALNLAAREALLSSGPVYAAAAPVVAPQRVVPSSRTVSPLRLATPPQRNAVSTGNRDAEVVTVERRWITPQSVATESSSRPTRSQMVTPPRQSSSTAAGTGNGHTERGKYVGLRAAPAEGRAHTRQLDSVAAELSQSLSSGQRQDVALALRVLLEAVGTSTSDANRRTPPSRRPSPAALGTTPSVNGSRSGSAARRGLSPSAVPRREPQALADAMRSATPQRRNISPGPPQLRPASAWK